MFCFQAGFLEYRGQFHLANFVSILLFFFTLLDHIGFIVIFWGWHGPGSAPGRFQYGVNLEIIFWEVVSFIVNNVVVYLTFLVCYAAASGRIVVIGAPPARQ